MSDTILILCCAAADAAIVWWFVQQKRRKLHKNDHYYHNVYDSIHQLNDRVVQLEELERMILDIETCNHKAIKYIRIEVPDSLTVLKSGASFVVNGKDESSKKLLSLAYSERDKLRSSLREDLGQIFRSGVTKTVTETNEFDERGVQGNG